MIPCPLCKTLMPKERVCCEQCLSEAASAYDMFDSDELELYVMQKRTLKLERGEL